MFLLNKNIFSLSVQFFRFHAPNIVRHHYLGGNMKVYVGQYGYFWSLSLDQWVELCKESSKGEGYDLTPYKQLKNKPNGLLKDWGTDSYYTVNNEIIYVEPLDWYAEDFEDWLKDNGYSSD